jgi:hypothetical protein
MGRGEGGKGQGRDEGLAKKAKCLVGIQAFGRCGLVGGLGRDRLTRRREHKCLAPCDWESSRGSYSAAAIRAASAVLI